MSAIRKIMAVIRVPKMSDLTDAPAQIKENLQKSKMNQVDVLLLDKDYRACDQVIGIKSRMTKIPIVTIKTPSPMAFFEVSSFFNRTTQKETIICVEDNCYAIDANREIIEQERNDYAAGEIGPEGYQVPILLNKIAYNVVKKDKNIKLNSTSDDEIIDLTPSLLWSLGEAKLAKDVTDEDTSVVPVTLLIGVLLGMALLALLQAFSN